MKTSTIYSIWVIVDRLNNSTHFLPIKVSYSAKECAKLYVKEIVKLHGSPLSITLNIEAQLISKFWRTFQSGSRLPSLVETTKALLGPYLGPLVGSR